VFTLGGAWDEVVGGLVQTKAWHRSFQPSMKIPIAVIRSLIEVKVWPTAPILPEEQRPQLHSAQDLDWVAAELNDRRRKRLGLKKPIEPLLLR